ncbi:AmmeMemoRadiSam system radical SAM enzyme [Candidatus Woesearchaeota archaeon]|nr:MAG: AmmeMemoRadiSam system radical SAM enzyme [Candidatus Woesearchaeota archaeon]
MHKAKYWRVLKDKTVQCQLCPRFCTIQPSHIGNCKTRKNIDGTLYAINYAKPVAVHIDPIEKKPLFHFLPSSTSFSIGTAGCNLHCKYCQNWQISQASPEDIPYYNILPEKIVEDALKNKCKSISYTYTEPNVFYEYVLDTAKIAKNKAVKNVLVTNAYINEKPASELYRYIDAANIDLKSFSDEFYKKICDASLEPVLKTIKLAKKKGVWIEITNLLIPTLNDSPDEIKQLCRWIADLDKNIPLHFSRFFPDYQMLNIQPTPVETLFKAYEIAKECGLRFVYIGNVISEKENTYCPKCGSLIIKRFGFSVLDIKIKNGKCNFCKEKIPGIWS